MHFNRKRINQLKIRISAPAKKKTSSVKKTDIKPVPSLEKRSRNRKVKMTTTKMDEGKALKDKNTFQPLERWTGFLEGHPAFLLGNGPSVSKVDLKLLSPYLTIGMNRIFYIYDPTFLMWQDRQVWTRDKKQLQMQKAIKICAPTADPKNLFLHFKVGTNPFRFSMNPYNLHGRGNTGVLAAQFAVALGCSALVLLGMDCQYSNGKTDFYGKNIDHRPYTLKMCRNAMTWLKKNSPVPVYNCSEIDLWSKQELVRVIEKLKPPKMSREKFKAIFQK